MSVYMNMLYKCSFAVHITWALVKWAIDCVIIGVAVAGVVCGGH